MPELIDIAKLVEALAGKLSDLTKETSELSKANALLKRQEEELYVAMMKAKSGTEADKKAFEDLKKSISDYKNETKLANLETGSLAHAQEKLRQNEEKLFKAMRDAANGTDKEKKALKELNKQIKEDTVAIEKYKKSLKDMGASFGDAFGEIKKGFNSVASGAKDFLGTLGIATFSLKDVAKAGIEYNRSLFEISRIQQTAGKSGESLAESMDYVSKHTNLSKIQFAGFAKVVQSGFLGIKPSLIETAKLSAALVNVVGPSFEAQKEAASKLMSIQSQFPSLYEKIREGMDLVAKIDSGRGDAADKNKLKNLQTEALMTSQLYGMNQESQQFILQATQELNEEQKKTIALETQTQAATKAADDAKLKFFTTLQPAIQKAAELATEVLQIFEKYSSELAIIAGSAVAVGVLVKTFTSLVSIMKVLKEAQIAFNLAAIMNPYVLLATAITATLVGIGYLLHKNYQNQKALNEEAEKNRQISEENNKIKELTKGFNEKEVASFNKLTEEGLKLVKTDKERMTVLKDVAKQIEKQKNDAKDLWLQQGLITQQVTEQLNVINKITDSYKQQIDILGKYGGISEDASSGLISSVGEAVKQTRKEVEGAIGAIQSTLGKTGVTISVDSSTDLLSQANAVQSQLQSQLKITDTEEKRKIILKSLSQLGEMTKRLRAEEMNLSDAQIAKDHQRQKQQEEFTSKYEARLNTERSLMESAQFGMGASVSMMQKQVDLAYEMMKVYEEIDRDRQKFILSTMKINKSELESIKNSRTHAEAAKKIYAIKNLEVGQVQYLLDYAVKHQELQQKSMEYQKKIYDLTKDIREGYLDAIREMSTGAGEFEKIIGTQEMGVTSLMAYVDKFGDTVGALNTMKTGGLQSAEATAGGTGTQVTGKYSASGGPMMSFLQGEGKGDSESARNKRIYGYQESIDKYNQMRNGEGETPTVGTGLGGGSENQYIRPFQEELDIGLKANEPVVDAVLSLKDIRNVNQQDIMWGVSGKFGGGKEWANYERRPSGSAFGMGLSANAGGANSFADPSKFARTAGPMPPINPDNLMGNKVSLINEIKLNKQKLDLLKNQAAAYGKLNKEQALSILLSKNRKEAEQKISDLTKLDVNQRDVLLRMAEEYNFRTNQSKNFTEKIAQTEAQIAKHKGDYLNTQIPIQIKFHPKASTKEIEVEPEKAKEEKAKEEKAKEEKAKEVKSEVKKSNFKNAKQYIPEGTGAGFLHHFLFDPAGQEYNNEDEGQVYEDPKAMAARRRRKTGFNLTTRKEEQAHQAKVAAMMAPGEAGIIKETANPQEGSFMWIRNQEKERSRIQSESEANSPGMKAERMAKEISSPTNNVRNVAKEQAAEQAEKAYILRQSVGVMKKKKGESAETYDARKKEALAKTLLTASEEGGPKYMGEDFKKWQAAAVQAQSMEYKKNGLSSEASRGMIMETQGGKKVFTSAAAEQRREATAEEQTAYQEQSATKDRIYGSGGEAGGGGRAEILIKLAPELVGKIESMSDVAVQITSAASSH